MGITYLLKRHLLNYSTLVKHHVKRYENFYHKATTRNDFLMFAFFFVLCVHTIVSFLLLNLVDLKFHRKNSLNFSWVQKCWTDLTLLQTSTSIPNNKKLPTSNWIWATSKWRNKFFFFFFLLFLRVGLS